MLRLRRGSIVCNRNWLVNAKSLSPACACQQSMSSTSHNYFDPDNTLSTLARYNFMNLLPLISNTSLNRPQSSRTEILIALIIMPNTIPEEHAAHITGCAIPCIQCRDTTVLMPLDILSLI